MEASMTVGDVVQLKSGGPKMTVVYVPEDGKYIKCFWHIETGALVEYVFPAEVLVPPQPQ
jgi:uncharacterized protein YodC (DUF2158 family)